MFPATVDILKTFPALVSVPDKQLYWLIENSGYAKLKDGEMLLRPDTPVFGTHFILAGSCLVYTLQKDRKREIGVIGTGEITGYLPYSRGRMTSVHICAEGEMLVMNFPYERMRELIASHFELTQALVHVMCNRIRHVTAVQLQNEKMMALGKLSAGMTHELNNPASANVSDAAILNSYFLKESQSMRDFQSLKLSHEASEAVLGLLDESLQARKSLSVTWREKRLMAERLEAWLADRNVENAFDLAEIFIEMDHTDASAQALIQHFPPAMLNGILEWISRIWRAKLTVANIYESSRRIAELVQSVKNYTHMDRGSEKQLTNIHHGLRNTVKMLDHKRRKNNVELVEILDPEIPEISALVGELNQVWTNLIDNGLDALEDQADGVIIIETYRKSNDIRVRITDNGPGISEENISRIFDPFFTTKDIGKGTGLGLDLVKGIVNQHRGSVTVSSIPGETVFEVCLPINAGNGPKFSTR